MKMLPLVRFLFALAGLGFLSSLVDTQSTIASNASSTITEESPSCKINPPPADRTLYLALFIAPFSQEWTQTAPPAAEHKS